MDKVIKKIKERGVVLYHLLKPEDVVDALVSIIAIAIIANGSIHLKEINRLISAILFGFFLFSGSIILHQYYDYESDKANKPYRPIVSGKIKRENVLIIAILFYCFAIMLSVQLGFTYLVISIGGILFSVIYSHPQYHSRKESIILPLIFLNIGYTVITFLIGWEVYQEIVNIPMGLLMFLFITDMGAVFCKDYRDYEGDKKQGYITLPIFYGYHRAAKINLIIYLTPFIILFILSLFHVIPIRFSIVGLYYIITGYYAFSLLFNDKNKANAIKCYHIITANLILIRVLCVWALVL